MQNPTVSFVVPCYKLAHLLPECVNSILSQSFSDFEVLIMDDCSPDNTAEVAKSFQDPRVKHIRNDPNLGHLRNYNKGISLARGRYIWLISADDTLRRPYILERYLAQLEKNPSVGFAFCSGVGLKHGQETGLLSYSVYTDKDRLVLGHELLKRLLKGNFVLAASGLARRECYDRLGAFPLDLPYAGDWYLWCLFALHFDVAYFAEPMVCYREHDGSMTTAMMGNSVESCCEEDVAVPWLIKQRADTAGFCNVSRDCLTALGYIYGRSMVSRKYDNCMLKTWEQVEASLDRHTSIEDEKIFVRSRACAALADQYFSRDDTVSARRYYKVSLGYDRWNIMVYMKMLLLSLGKSGKSLRKALRSARERGILSFCVAKAADPK
jgi:glycosyltransferase involved in cell wall biosynthesis